MIKTCLCLCLIGVLMLAISGCSAEQNATKAFEGMMQAFQSGEKEQILPYYDFDAATSKVVAQNKTELEAAILGQLKDMHYEMVSAEKADANTVTVQAKITMSDFSAIMNQYVAGVMEMVQSEDYQSRVGTMTKEEYQTLLSQKMIQILNNQEFGTVEETVTVTMVKANGGWQLGTEGDNFINTLFANLANAVSSLV